MIRRGLSAFLFSLAAAAAWAADRTQVYSIQGADCASCAEKVKGELKKAKGIGKVEFDRDKVELTVRMDDQVGDQVVLDAISRAGLQGIVGPGQGKYLPQAEYPAGADLKVLTNDGSAVGKLDTLRVPGKYTVFDAYADWCGPCRIVDEQLREIVGTRTDVAVRKLNVVDFESALARELGPSFDSLPYLVIYTPAGKRIEVVGSTEREKLEKALRTK